MKKIILATIVGVSGMSNSFAECTYNFDASVQDLKTLEASSLAREFQPKGIHVAYCMVEKWDGQNPHFISSIKQVCQHIYHQSDSAWSQELSVS